MAWQVGMAPGGPGGTGYVTSSGYKRNPGDMAVNDLGAYNTTQSRLDLLRQLGDPSYEGFARAPDRIGEHPLFAGGRGGGGQLSRDPNGVYRIGENWLDNAAPSQQIPRQFGGGPPIGPGQRFTPQPGGGGPPVGPDNMMPRTPGGGGPPDREFYSPGFPRQPGGGGPPVTPGIGFPRQPGGGSVPPTTGQVAGGNDFMSRPQRFVPQPGGGGPPVGADGLMPRTPGGPERGPGYVEPTFTGNADYNSAVTNPMAALASRQLPGGGPPVGPGGIMPRTPGGGGPPETGGQVAGAGDFLSRPGREIAPRTTPGPPATGPGSYPPPIGRSGPGDIPPAPPIPSGQAAGGGVTVGAGETYTNPAYAKQLQPGGDQGYWKQPAPRPPTDEEQAQFRAAQDYGWGQLAASGAPGQPPWVQALLEQRRRMGGGHPLFGG